MRYTSLFAATLFMAGAFGGCAQFDRITPAEMEEAASQRSPIIGKSAPAFALLDEGEREVTSEGLRGTWLVLYFYPKDDTPGCKCQATEFTRLLKKFREMNARVVGVSEDTPESHRTFRRKYRLQLTLLSDPDHAVMQRYGAWVMTALGEESYGRVVRSTVIIDPEGVIRHHWPEVIPRGHADRVRQRLAVLQGQPGG